MRSAVGWSPPEKGEVWNGDIGARHNAGGEVSIYRKDVGKSHNFESLVFPTLLLTVNMCIYIYTYIWYIYVYIHIWRLLYFFGKKTESFRNAKKHHQHLPWVLSIWRKNLRDLGSICGLSSKVHRKKGGETLQKGGPLIINPVYTQYIVGIYEVCHLFKGLLAGGKQLGYHPKGATIFRLKGRQ